MIHSAVWPLALLLLAASPDVGDPSPAAFLGTWQGTSTCVDLKVAPACHDEVVVYDVVRAEKAGSLTVKADKVVDGKRLPMGDLEFTYSPPPDACWRSDAKSARFHSVWCLKVQGDRASGTLRRFEDNAVIRVIELKRK